LAEVRPQFGEQTVEFVAGNHPALAGLGPHGDGAAREKNGNRRCRFTWMSFHAGTPPDSP
jgi:hypothetical protein